MTVRLIRLAGFLLALMLGGAWMRNSLPQRLFNARYRLPPTSEFEMESVTFIFTGRFEPASFADFARHRIARLTLDAGQLDLRRDRVRITVSGQADLVDAFEMACSLGPIDCLVEDVVRYPLSAA